MTGDRAADLRAGVLRVNQEIERLVRMAPDQYLWIHDRYRTQPKPEDVVVDAGGADEDADDSDGAADAGA